MTSPPAATGPDLVAALRALGVAPGDLVMVHASLRALGPAEGGPMAVAEALLDAVSPGGTLMAYVSWDRSPYEETLNGRMLTADERAAWPAFDPATAGPDLSFGALNLFLLRLAGVERSLHPDASMAAVGPDARALVHPHPLDSAYGPGSPVERFVRMGGKVLLLGAPLDAVTVLHYAEAIADIPGKRRVRYQVPVADLVAGKRWLDAEEWDSNGILDVFAQPGAMDAVETIARAYVAEGRHRAGRVGRADCHLFDAADLVRFGVGWLESRFGR